jgi:glucose/arabinose dehydrogenase
MISVQNTLFERWQGDLIVSSLKAQKLFRLRVREGRVVFAEPIHIGMRIRDLVEMQNGAIVLKTDTGTFVRLLPSPKVHAEGRQLANEPMGD